MKILFDQLSLYSKAAKLSLENAEQWIEDARLLMKHSSFGHANALLRIAIEEIAKADICWFTAEKMWPLENKVIRDVFRYHKVKIKFLLSTFSAALWMGQNILPKKVTEVRLNEPSEEEIFEALEELENMTTAVEKMRQKAMYVDVNLEKKEIETPLKIGKKKSESLLKAAEFFLKLMRYYMEKFPEEKKAVVRKFFSSIPREAWKTGEIPIEWFKGE